jgi:hypothetical protein
VRENLLGEIASKMGNGIFGAKFSETVFATI